MENNLVLRALEPQDIDIIYTWENDVEIWQNSNTYAPFSRYVLEQYILSAQQMDIQSSKQLRLMVDVIIDKEPRTVGCIDIFDCDFLNKRAGVGILVDKGYRGKGIATEAIKKLCQYAKAYLMLHQLYANIEESNVSSIKAFEKNGFEMIGVKKDWICCGGKFRNECMFQKIL